MTKESITGANEMHLLMEIKYTFLGISQWHPISYIKWHCCSNIINQADGQKHHRWYGNTTWQRIVGCRFPSPQTTGRAQTSELNRLRQWNLAGNLKIYGCLVLVVITIAGGVGRLGVLRCRRSLAQWGLLHWPFLQLKSLGIIIRAESLTVFYICAVLTPTEFPAV